MSEPHSPNLAHDLRGPLVTIEGFVGEIALVLDELEGLIADGAPTPEVAARLAVLLDADLRPCVDFVIRAAAMLHARIDALDESPPQDDPSGQAPQ